MPNVRYLVELDANPKFFPGSSREDRLKAIRESSNSCRTRFMEYLPQLRSVDPELEVDLTDSVFPVVMIRTSGRHTAPILQQLRRLPPGIVKKIKSPEGLSIPDEP